MKVKLDFVSNSSSTSFVYISDVELTEALFLQAAGVDKDGPVGDLFCRMYEELISSMGSGDRITSEESIEEAAQRQDFTPDVIDRIRKGVLDGKNVIVGSLDSDGPLAESALCMAVFEVESDSFYINGYNNTW